MVLYTALERGIYGKIEVLLNGIKSKEYGRSFAISRYDKIISNDRKINYIIFTHSSRVEEQSKDFSEIKEKNLMFAINYNLNFFN